MPDHSFIKSFETVKKTKTIDELKNALVGEVMNNPDNYEAIVPGAEELVNNFVLAARALLHGCSCMLPIEPVILDNLKKFVIAYVNGSNELSCAETRTNQWENMKKKNTLRIMPDDDTLTRKHIYLFFSDRQILTLNFLDSLNLSHLNMLGNKGTIKRDVTQPL